MSTRSPNSKKIDSLRDIISSLETTAQVRSEIKEYALSLQKRLLSLSQDYYASLVYMFTTPLSFHQRLILMQLIAIYPQGSSGIDLARSLGISVQSKSIYRDLNMLKNENLVRLDEVHSRLKLAYANSENRLINRLIELVDLHGQELQELLLSKKQRSD
jgi:hypothetical protein